MKHQKLIIQDLTKSTRSNSRLKTITPKLLISQRIPDVTKIYIQ